MYSMGLSLRTSFTSSQRKHIAKVLVRCWYKFREHKGDDTDVLVDELKQIGFDKKEIREAILSHITNYAPVPHARRVN